MTKPARTPRPGAGRVFWGSVVLFTALFALLAYRFAREQTAGATATPTVQVRKVIKRRIVTTIVPSPGRDTVSSGPASSASYSSGAEPVVTGAS